MNAVKRFVMVIAMLTLSIWVSACATVPPQVPVQVQNAVFAKTGDTVHLFHGGSKLAREEFCLNAVVPVYRYEGRYSSLGSTGLIRNEVGKIKITKDLGEYYVEGVVVEGSMKSGDVAVQPQSGCLINVPESEKK
ncbi:MAG: hypothetical protein NDI77_06930 [Geobacteraceae bacterium]|nr:hypothetical protein [Geobacteraceae bacterium]